jgi:hypothetical protein
VWLRLLRQVMLTLVALIGVASSVFGQQLGPAPSPDSTRTPDTAAVNPRAAQPERPTVATHAYTIAPGYVEIETGVQEARPRDSTQFIAPMVVKIGILSRLQMEVQGGYMRTAAPGTTTAGSNDIAVALKQRVLDAAPILHDFSVQGAIKFPTGAHDIGTGTTDLSLLLISSRPIGAAELDLNMGYTHRSGDGTTTPTSATFLTASFGMPLYGPLSGVAELFSYPGTSGPAGTPPAVGLLVGPTLQLRPWLVFDAGTILNVQHMGANAIYAGVTYNAGRIPGFPSHQR